jgi:hypothetical protein
MTIASLWVGWAIAAIPLISAGALLIYSLDKSVSYWAMAAFPFVIFLKSWLLSLVMPLNESTETPMTKKQRKNLVFFALFGVGWVALLAYFGLREPADKEAVIAISMIGLLGLWGSECHQLWRQYASRVPNK